MLNCTESITSPRLSGVTMATMSRMTAQPDSAARRGLCVMPVNQLIVGAACERTRAQARNAGWPTRVDTLLMGELDDGSVCR